ncbi:hypothetical protein GCM10009665_64110 [Kitasatospora nipponensis]|uniref:LPXTG-motif cell wall-anchored protein n=1 Tax=Kitasatospora nipponensis TaxID=258049 RepID=A0ABP4HKJ7_9ACTN
MNGTAQDVHQFLTVGRYDAAAKDKAAAASPSATQNGTAAPTQPTAAASPTAVAPTTATPSPGNSAGATHTATPTSTPTATPTTALASTGGGTELPWELGVTAVALTAGAGLLVVTRRRRSNES